MTDVLSNIKSKSVAKQNNTLSNSKFDTKFKE